MDPQDRNEDNWIDVTSKYRDLVSNLSLGELIKPDTFTLLEAMTAFEVMDPKMDSGRQLMSLDRVILTFEQSVKAGKIKISNLQLDELIGIIDDTYACVASWLDGRSILLTIMTNLYLHDTEKIEDRCLRIFCQTILKIADVIDKMIVEVYCIEEEDFEINNGTCDLASKLNSQKVLSSLEDLCEYYEKIYDELGRNNNPSNSSNKNKSSKTNKQQESGERAKVEEVPQNLFDKSQRLQIKALLTRLKFTRHLYSGFLNLYKNYCKQQVLIPVQNAQAQKIVKVIQGTATFCDDHFEKCLRYLDYWKATIEMGIKPQPVNVDQDENDINYPTIMGFDPWVNHQLIPPACLRFLRVRSRPDTLDYFKDMLIKLRKCIAISSLFHQSKSFIKTLEAIEKFSKYSIPKSCVVSRSFLQLLYLPNRLMPLLKEEILQSMTEYCEPIVQMLRKDEQKFATLNEFLDECARLVSHIVLVYGHNPVRQHERFADIIVSFRNLQYSAYLLGDLQKNMMAYSWTTYYFMKFCMKYVLSGFELEIYSQHEYPYVFWYIFEVLLRNEREQLEMAKKLVVTTCEQTMNESDSKNTAKLTKTKVKKRLSKLDNMMEIFHDKNLLLNEAMTNLIHGLFLLSYGLKLQGIIKSPSDEYTTTKTSFEHRFGIITGGSSLYFSYSQSMAARSRDLKEIYQEAGTRLRRATMLFEKCQDQTECLAVSKANNVVAMILYTNPQTFVDRRVEFCFDKHPSLPVIKI